MRYARALVLLGLLSGCNRHLIGTSTPTPPQSILAAGQSNMAFMLNNTPEFPSMLHFPLASSVANLAIPGSSLAQWDRGGQYNASLIGSLKAQKTTLLIWWQGEADAGDTNYGQRFTNFLLNVRHDAGLPGLVVVFMRLGNSANNPGWDVVKAGQDSVHLPLTYMLTCDDVPQDSTHVHYLPEQYHVLAQRFADELNDLMSKPWIL